MFIRITRQTNIDGAPVHVGSEHEVDADTAAAIVATNKGVIIEALTPVPPVADQPPHDPPAQ